MKILVVDDEKSVISTISDIFEGNDVFAFERPDHALAAIRCGCNYDIVIMDYRMQRTNGMELLKEVKKFNASYKAILLTAYSTEQVLEEGINNGLFNRLVKKTFDPKELKTVVEELYETLISERCEKEDYYTRLRKDLSSIIDTGTIFIYLSDKMKRIHEKAIKIAKSSVNVLIEGESGVGKEIVAQVIHSDSCRANVPMVTINCSSIAENVFESEMFGHKKGAFTGAFTDNPGKFKSANGGTIFLDEIGDMPLSQQAKLLRVIENMEISPVGGSMENVDVRIICATNKNLAEMVEHKTFREDLYHRLNIANIYIPPLHQRREDIPLLATYFMDDISRKEGFTKKMGQDCIEYLKLQEYKGNVRELRSLIYKSYLFSIGENITVNDIKNFQKEKSKVTSSNPFDRNLTLPELEMEYICYQLKKNDSSLTETARILEMEVSNFSRKLKNMGISVKNSRKSEVHSLT
jgi:DNA-binding NtrC family response regulator